MGISDEMVHPLTGPAYRYTKLLGGDHQQRVFPVTEGLGAKTATNLGRDNLDVLLFQAEHLAENVAHAVAALRAERQLVAFGVAVVLGHTAAQFHVVRDNPVVDDLNGNGLVRRLEGRIGSCFTAMTERESEIAAVFGPDLDRIGRQRILNADNNVQRLVVHFKHLGGISGDVDIVGDHESDRVSDVAHLVRAEQRLRWQPVIGPVDLFQPGHCRQGISLNISAGQHKADAFYRPYVLSIFNPDFRMGHCRTHNDSMQTAIRLIIACIYSLASDKRFIFLAAQRRADTEFRSDHLVHKSGPVFWEDYPWKSEDRMQRTRTRFSSEDR